MKRNKVILLILLVVAFFTTSVAQSMNGMKDMHMDGHKNMIQKAVCVLTPTQGNNVTGVVTFTKVEGGIQVIADLKGLTPGKHGIHIHEYGDITSADGTSTGGHFNPTGETHGAPMDNMRHEGDMGNIQADASGNAHLEYVDKDLSFVGMTSIIGRGVIVHKGEDDFKTQPTGNSGARVASGVIGIAK